MSYDVGAGGAFGLLLSEYKEHLGQTYDAFLEQAQAYDDGYVDDEATSPDFEGVSDRHIEPMRQAFYVIGIVVPESAYFIQTGTEDERPGRTVTPPDDFVLGFGLYTMPWDFPAMHESFQKAADWHTWVWGG
jgi:hypothetical protein